MGDLAALDYRLAALARVARYEVLACYPDVVGVGALVSRIGVAAGTGVVVRHLVPDHRVVPAGYDVRVCAPLPAGLFVFDRATAFVDSVMVSERGSVALLGALFEQMWADALPVGLGGLTDQQAIALRLLADGHTDEVIAKRLGVSARTARRIVTRLMARLGARGRFQAGVRAVEAGWLAGSSLDAESGSRCGPALL